MAPSPRERAVGAQLEARLCVDVWEVGLAVEAASCRHLSSQLARGRHACLWARIDSKRMNFDLPRPSRFRLTEVDSSGDA
jgi:hypothetical protein